MICGSLSGIGSCLSGYMLDTTKVKMQIERISMVSCISRTIRKDGVFGFYKGVYYPLVTNPAVNAMNFGVYELYKRVKGERELSFKGGLEAGAVSGLLGALLVSPVEKIKCTMQTQTNTFKTSKQCLLHLFKTQGISGLYQGMISTILREIPSIAGQFASY